jgi:hypothetical protein
MSQEDEKKPAGTDPSELTDGQLEPVAGGMLPIWPPRDPPPRPHPDPIPLPHPHPPGPPIEVQ